jgi:hypothetical protein
MRMLVLQPDRVVLEQVAWTGCATPLRRRWEPRTGGVAMARLDPSVAATCHAFTSRCETQTGHLACDLPRRVIHRVSQARGGHDQRRRATAVRSGWRENCALLVTATAATTNHSIAAKTRNMIKKGTREIVGGTRPKVETELTMRLSCMSTATSRLSVRS